MLLWIYLKLFKTKIGKSLWIVKVSGSDENRNYKGISGIGGILIKETVILESKNKSKVNKDTEKKEHTMVLPKFDNSFIVQIGISQYKHNSLYFKWNKRNT